MKPEKQRIAIAEACGIVTKDQWGPLYGTPHGFVRDCPDYLTDLNAMHEAEMTLNWEEQQSTQADKYRYALTKVCGNDRDLIHVATAAQRAEAFLRTLGKWEEGE